MQHYNSQKYLIHSQDHQFYCYDHGKKAKKNTTSTMHFKTSRHRESALQSIPMHIADN